MLTDHEKARLAYASFLLEDVSLVYVETPKAACSSFKHSIAALSNTDYSSVSESLMAAKSVAMAIHDRQRVSIPSLADVSPEKFQGVITDPNTLRFCVVRNPFDRIASAWADRIMCHSISPLAPVISCLGFPKYWPDLGYLKECFGEFVDHLYRNESQQFSNHHWHRLEDLLLPDRLNYNLVVKVEKLAEGLPVIIDHLTAFGRVWPGLPRLNETPLKLGRELYTARTARKVAELYETDFTRFGYDLSPDSTDALSVRLPDIELIRAVQERNQRIFHLSLKARGMT